jgi:hypothetical protein
MRMHRLASVAPSVRVVPSIALLTDAPEPPASVDPVLRSAVGLLALAAPAYDVNGLYDVSAPVSEGASAALAAVYARVCGVVQCGGVGGVRVLFDAAYTSVEALSSAYADSRWAAAAAAALPASV